MVATVFRFHRLIDGQHVAWALICVDARYASVAVPSVQTFLRRHVIAAQWPNIAHELDAGLPPGPLPAAGSIATLLAGGPYESKSLVIQYVTQRDVAPDPSTVGATLDAMLREFTVAA